MYAWTVSSAWMHWHKCSTGPLHELVVLSPPFSKAAAGGSTSELDPVDFDNKVDEGITQLNVSANLFHKFDFSCLARSSCHWLPVLATITSESADNCGDKDLGISDNWIADNVAFQTRTSHGVWQPSCSNYFEKSTLVVSLQRTTCIYMGAASMLPFVSASFSNANQDGIISAIKCPASV